MRGGVDTVAETADRFDQIDAELLAQAADKNLDRIGVAVKILIVEMFRQFGARDHLVGMVHEIFQHLVFMGGELDRIAIDGHTAGAQIEAHRPADKLVGGMAGGATHERADAGQHFLDVERLGDVIVGAGIDALDLVGPAVAGGQ
jgi:hypothetical protein